MNKKGLGLLVIIAIIVGVIILGAAVYQIPAVKDLVNQGIQQTSDFIQVRYYDSNGNLITDPNTLSIVGGVPGVSYIDLTVTASNTGGTVLTCAPTTTTPTAFDSALSKTAKVVPIIGTKKSSWTSNLISVSAFEGTPTPDVFSATIRCYYTIGSGEQVYLTDKTGSISLTIQPDASGSFTVDVTSGGTGTEFCGDGICTSGIGETATTCPGDCAVAGKVKFRTSDLSYPTGSAIAYNSGTCGNALTQYGHYTQTGLISGTCTAANIAIGCGTTPSKLFDIPGGYLSGGAVVGLWKPTEANTLCVCDDSGTTYRVIKYLTTDPDATNVGNSGQAYDSSKEISC